MQKAVQLRIRESIQGMGGLETLLRFFRQMSDIHEMAQLCQTISVNLLAFQTARNITDKANIRRKSLEERTEQIIKLLGPKEYKSLIQMFAKQRRFVSPEVIGMWWAFGKQKIAYEASYIALGLVFNFIAQRTGWGSFRIDNVRFLDYLELSRVEAIKGESRISMEEKNLLQFNVYGNLAAKDSEGKELVTPALAHFIIDRGVDVLRLGYVQEVLDPSFLEDYERAQASFTPFYHQIFRAIQPAVNVMLQFGFKPHFQIEVKDGSYWFPFLITPDETWNSGTITGEVNLFALPERPGFPMFPKAEQGVHILIISQSGKGKTVVMSSLASYSITRHAFTILQPIYDDGNQPQFSVMPLFPYNTRTEQLHSFLTEQLHIEPKGIPCMTLNIIHPNEIGELEREPLTKYDRIIYVNSHEGFKLNWKKIFAELQNISHEMGYAKTCGMIGVRDLHRTDRETNVNLDLRVCAGVLSEFEIFRTHYHDFPMGLMIDEVAERAPSHYTQAGGDQASVVGSIMSDYRRFRRKNVSTIVASQRVREFLGEIRDASSNVLFRDLPRQQQRESSQIDQALDMFELDEASKALVKDYTLKGTLSRPGTWFWWWYHRERRKVELIWAIPPCFCLEDVQLNPEALFKKYESEYPDQKILVDDVNEVPVLMTQKETASDFRSRFRATLTRPSTKQTVPLGVGRI